MKKEIEKEIPGLMWGDDPDLEVETLPLGIHVIDEAMNGGFPFGRISIIYGEQATGKTTFCLFVIKQAQAMGLSCAYLDVEKKLDPAWAKAIGVDLSNLMVLRPRTAEESLGALTTLVEKNVAVIVLDSIAALSTQAELEADQDKKFMGEVARIAGDIIKRMNSNNKRSMILMINQVREKIGMVFGNPETLPGGRSQRFFSTMIVRVRRGSYIEEGTKTEKVKIGYNLRIIVEKDQHGTPFKEAEVPFFFTGKIDEVAALVSTALAMDVIEQKGPYFYFGEDKWLGKAGLSDAIKEDEQLRNAIEAKLNSIEEIDI